MDVVALILPAASSSAQTSCDTVTAFQAHENIEITHPTSIFIPTAHLTAHFLFLLFSGNCRSASASLCIRRGGQKVCQAAIVYFVVLPELLLYGYLLLRNTWPSG
ncbi:hypothetical protein F5888DRAFT_1710778 [Russula emetica]|nr:hypothetical protein F5888DRAFT_1710778 [Russula emetica]